MSRLYIDTATSDRWKYGKDIPDTTQPHMVRLAWLLETDAGATIRDASHLIRMPQGLQMAGETQHVTGIYQHAVDARGLKLFEVLTEFADALGEATLVVGFAWTWQRQALERSMRYVGMPDRIWPAALDAMFSATSVVRVPATQIGRKWQTPSYDQTCEKLLGAQYSPTMDPVADGITRVRNVRTIYMNIVRAGLA